MDSTSTRRQYENHGQSRTPLYRRWQGMRARCENESDPRYDRYGRRGIKVCERWQSYVNFAADMGPTFREELTIDRIDVDGDYEPGNCRWATDEEQQNNRSDNRHLTAFGQTMTLARWCRILELTPTTVIKRLNTGMDVEDALNYGASPDALVSLGVVPLPLMCRKWLHELTDDNVYLWRGYRICRACRRENAVRFQSGKKDRRHEDPLIGRWETVVRHARERDVPIRPEWRESFEAFAQDMRPGFSPGLVLVRRDATGPYSPSNCEWATPKGSSRRRRSSNVIEWRGRSACLAEWEELVGVAAPTIRARLKRGWGIERALTTDAAPDALARFLADTGGSDAA